MADSHLASARPALENIVHPFQQPRTVICDPENSAVEKQKAVTKINPNAVTLPALKEAATNALNALKDSEIEYPPLAVAVLATPRNPRDRLDLLALGKTHRTFALTLLLYRTLPREIISRGSITQMRQAFLSRDGTKSLAGKFKRPRVVDTGYLDDDILDAAFGALAEGSSAEAVYLFVEEAFQPAVAVLAMAAEGLPSLQDSKQDVQDNTRKVLAKIQRDVQGNNSVELNQRKRRLSPGKENEVLLAPDSSLCHIKRRKSLNGAVPPDVAESPLVKVTPSPRRRRNSVHGDRVSGGGQEAALLTDLRNRVIPQLHLTDSSGAVTVESALPLSPVAVGVPETSMNDAISPTTFVETEPVEAILAQDALPQTGESIPKLEQDVQDTRIALTDPSFTDDTMSPTMFVETEPVEAVPAQDALSQTDQSSPKLEQDIQNALIVALTDPSFTAEFLELPTWDLLFGPAHIRNPIETVGDAAMDAVVVELLIEFFAGEVNGDRGRQALRGPLTSNATFLYILQSREFVWAKSTSEITEQQIAAGDTEGVNAPTETVVDKAEVAESQNALHPIHDTTHVSESVGDNSKIAVAAAVIELPESESTRATKTGAAPGKRTGKLPKWPGNAWEVYAGSVALLLSFQILKNMSGRIYQPLLVAGSEAVRNFDLAKKLQAGKQKASKARLSKEPDRKLKEKRKKAEGSPRYTDICGRAVGSSSPRSDSLSSAGKRKNLLVSTLDSTNKDFIPPQGATTSYSFVPPEGPTWPRGLVERLPVSDKLSFEFKTPPTE
ncbi:hypothetical protein C8R43DRAFT_1119286 [Mycena crocata]|nr:hypothetical protein C8R43DRAFT_1119286 [Mycena crocata]